MIHLDSPTASPLIWPWLSACSSEEFTWLIINLKTTRTRWTLVFPTNTACAGHPSQYQTDSALQNHCLSSISTAVSSHAARLHPNTEMLFHIISCIHQSLLCFMLPHPNDYFLSIILIANSKQIKRWGWVFLCPGMLCLASSFIWDGSFSGNIKQGAQRSQCPSSPAAQNPPRSALKLLFLRGFWAVLPFPKASTLPWSATRHPTLHCSEYTPSLGIKSDTVSDARKYWKIGLLR